MLREAGYPPEIADRVGSWFTPKVMQYLKGARGLDESLTFEQSKELDKIRNNPTKVKVFFEQHRKETPIYQKYKKMKKAVNERYVAKHREQIRESKRKWNEKHKNYNKEYFQKNKERLMETTKKNKRIYSAVKKVLKESGGYDTKELKAKKYEPSAQQLVAAANEGSYEGSYEGSKSSASEDKI